MTTSTSSRHVGYRGADYPRLAVTLETPLLRFRTDPGDLMSTSLSAAVASLALGALATPSHDAAAPASKSGAAHFHVVRRFDVGGEGRWDYLSVDVEARRLYVSRSTHVMVVDLDTGKTVGDIPETPGVHGIALVPELHAGFISNGKDASVTVFDTRTLKVLEKVKTGENPDAIVYDPASKAVLAFNGRSRSATAIDARAEEGKPRATRTLDLGGKPEFAAADGAGRVFVNLEDTNEVVAIDSKKLSILARWPLTPGEEPSGMAIDPKHRRIFVTCGNQKMLMLDADSGRVVAVAPIGKGTDACAFDPASALAFSSNGEGTLTVAHVDGPSALSVVQTVPTVRGAKTMALDPKSHRVYLGAQETEGAKGFVILELDAAP